jgi:hypothetical protein
MSQVPTGWQCPCCKVVHAPAVQACKCAAQVPSVFSPTTATTTVKVWPAPDQPGYWISNNDPKKAIG